MYTERQRQRQTEREIALDTQTVAPSAPVHQDAAEVVLSLLAYYYSLYLQLLLRRSCNKLQQAASGRARGGGRGSSGFTISVYFRYWYKVQILTPGEP